VLLLIGMRPVAALAFMVTFVCGHCGTRATQRVIKEQQKLTLFFIPLLSLGTSWFVECDHCGIATGLSRQQAEHSLDWARSHGYAVAA
jgi:uncharacterized Zn finger protein